jgi:hypothetical protein
MILYEEGLIDLLRDIDDEIKQEDRNTHLNVRKHQIFKSFPCETFSITHAKEMQDLVIDWQFRKRSHA